MKTRSIFSTFVLGAGLMIAALVFAESQAVTGIDVHEAKQISAAQGDVIIMDVRTPAEFQMSHIPQAVNLNVQDDDFKSMAGMLDRDKTYIVHCTKNPADGRSSAALETLQELGFRNLYSLEGGYIAWKDADLPLIEDEN